MIIDMWILYNNMQGNVLWCGVFVNVGHHSGYEKHHWQLR